MTAAKRWTLWLTWLLLSLTLAGVLGYELFAAKEKPNFLIGEATHGHHQIELACGSCHLEPFGGKELVHNACLTCHEEELNAVDDSHPIKKFMDPRNADRVAILDARNCVTCHNEHQLEQTGEMGLTLPQDFCFRCHEDIAEERPSHESMAFDSCASAGCHNYHDNTALYEAFLLKHQSAKAVDWQGLIMPTSINDLLPKGTPLSAAQADIPEAHTEPETSAIREAWAHSDHASAGVNCTDCHNVTEPDDNNAGWQSQPGIAACESCHGQETAGFLAGKHGMKLAAGLGAMTPAAGRLAFHSAMADHSLSCSSCHDPHRPDLQAAAVDSCLNCHNDEHSRNYKASPHYQRWQQELAGELEAGSGVSCASCHMPRMEINTAQGAAILVQHNQNLTLRPNEKMIRSTCMQCHSLAFSIDALADPELIQNNFSETPDTHIPSIDMAVERDKTQ